MWLFEYREARLGPWLVGQGVYNGYTLYTLTHKESDDYPLCRWHKAAEADGVEFWNVYCWEQCITVDYIFYFTYQCYPASSYAEALHVALQKAQSNKLAYISHDWGKGEGGWATQSYSSTRTRPTT